MIVKRSDVIVRAVNWTLYAAPALSKELTPSEEPSLK